MLRTSAENQELLDSGLTAITKSRRNYFLIAPVTDKARQVLLFGEGKKAYIMKLRLVLEVMGTRTIHDENDLEHRLIIFRGSDDQKPHLVVADANWDYCISSLDDHVDCQLTAFMVCFNPLTHEAALKKADSIPFAVRAQFNNCGPAPSVGAMALVHDEALAALWDYDMELIRPSISQAKTAVGAEYEEESDGTESYPTGRSLRW